MTFPISSGVSQSNPTFPTADRLKIDGNAGQIPTAFQYSLWAGEALLSQGVDPMTPAQWSAWSNQDDANYILLSVAENLGLTLGAPAKSRAGKRKSK